MSQKGSKLQKRGYKMFVSATLKRLLLFLLPFHLSLFLVQLLHWLLFFFRKIEFRKLNIDFHNILEHVLSPF